MFVIAARELLHHPRDLAVLPSGEVLVLSWSPESMHLDCYDPELALVWHLALGKDALGFSVDGSGVLWVVDRRGVSALTAKGEVWHRIGFRPPDGMDVSGFAFVDGDVVFACQHALYGKPCEPLLTRVKADGTVHWLSTLSSDRLDFDDDVQHSSGMQQPWVPREWFNGYLSAGTLTVSGDVLFLAYTDMSSGASLGYAVGVADGTLRYTAEAAILDDVTAMSDGGFLIGCSDHTTLYNRHGHPVTQWHCGGIHVVRGSDIRVLEKSNIGLSGSRTARLMPDGSVIRGDLIDGFDTSRPYIDEDGTIIFVRNGMLTRVHDLTIVSRQFIHRSDEHDIISTRVLPVSDGVVTTYSRDLRDSSDRMGMLPHQSGLVRLGF